ncbi:MAG: flagellar biosynthesis protein FlhF [bacterium]|nr:flagellar biosynthesis protein FlhF [bacterium]
MENLRTFEADSMAEALDQVKRRFGRDAVILHTRTLTRGGVLGLGGRTVVEVTAARDTGLLPSGRGGIVKRRPGQDSATKGAVGVSVPGCVESSRAPQMFSSDAGAVRGGSTDISESDLRAQLSELRSMMAGVVRDAQANRLPALPEHLLESYTRLIQDDVAEELAMDLVGRVRRELTAAQLADPRAVRRQLAAYVESLLPVAGAICLAERSAPTVVALVGPTGVGKTTTIAKLAANFQLREGRKVGLITIDTYRIAAVDQLRTYAQIINVPLEVVTAPAEMRAAVQAMSDCDIVLVDTVGRSQADREKIKEMKIFLDEAPPHEVHLVLASTSSRQVLADALERFGELGVDRVLFTKLDEAVGFGAMLTCLTQAQTRLSYITTGQAVPEDIEVGHGGRVARLMMGEGRISPCRA